MKCIATLRNDFHSKFGLPRQSLLAPELLSTIVFEPPYRDSSALRGIEQFSHLWLLWDFSEVPHDSDFQPTVRPPRLGGNRRVGVFASRSPFRPNPIGLTCVRLLDVELSASDGPILHVAGADMMDGTPIYDIKPYIPIADCHPEATSGYTEATSSQAALDVDFLPGTTSDFTPEQVATLRQVLSQDPRPHYHTDSERVYTFSFAHHEVSFVVPTAGMLQVVKVMKK
ncbi:MAG: tRNA (N6-threonylcarbamoyladenosine(37)-N6)-methyltransferase TrmO [Bacteroidales bacterium]|nr:tRNA (N6-threonylcarbamoyladenosine(37)-N6)-methyltransferase TrmO [Candidatus Physcousia equi]